MLTNSQDKALSIAKSWIQSGGKLLKLGGPAGSGKSFLIPLIADLVGIENCLLVTPTGKAANNLQKAGLKAKTIHSTIYHVHTKEELGFESELKKGLYKESQPAFELKDPDTYRDKKLIIVDEGSMVGGRLLKDLLTFDVPILMVGDPNQLAPVDDSMVYTSCDFYLDEVVRQAKDSPIIWLSQQALRGSISPGWYGNCLVRKGVPEDSELLLADVVLADTNSRRNDLNLKLRSLTFGEGIQDDIKNWIIENDKVICRTNTAAYVSTEGYPLTNGTLGLVVSIKHRNSLQADFVMNNYDLGSYRLIGTMVPLRHPPDDRPPTIEYGYALTVHLSQGSEWNKVIYDASSAMTRRGLYTAITRAKESLLITL